MRADVGALTVQGGGIVGFPEGVEHLVIGDDRGIVFDLDHLGVAGFSAADLAVGGVLFARASASDADAARIQQACRNKIIEMLGSEGANKAG